MTGRHAILASAYAGDIGPMECLGALRANIVGIECNKRSYDAFVASNPRVKAIFGFAKDVIPISSISRFRSIFLDFTSNLSDQVIETSAHCALALENGGVLGVAVLRGREFGARMKEIESAAGECARYADRAVVLARKVSELAKDIALIPRGLIVYQNGPSPMLISRWIVINPSDKKNVSDELYKKIGEALDSEKKDEIVKIESEESAYRRSAAMAVHLADLFPVEKLLGVSRARLAAMKAHHMRGTYGHCEMCSERTA